MKRSKKVLVVEDNPGILDAISTLLTVYGLESAATADGKEVFSQVDKHKPDLIILDVKLEGEDGRTICKNLKEHPSYKHLPIIMISAHPNVAQSALSAGADEFIAKPFDIKDLENRIHKYI